MLKIRTILMFLQFKQVLGSIKNRIFDNVDGLRTSVGNISTNSTACGRPSGTFRQIRQLADGRREHFDKFDGLRTSVGNISTNSTACGRASGTFRQIRRTADGCREHFDSVEAGNKI
ncbi:MAG: hypothetical protein LBK58_09815 [Prevotellaceae bacterium]|nr:hypothetical protein [Prevotellaceae bacterium]